MNRISKISLPLLACFATAAWGADDAALQRCRGIGESAARLACYDALPLGAGPALAPAPVAPGASAPAATAPAPVSKTQSLLARFGFEQRVQPDELPYVESHIPGRFEGWGPNSLIRLANGQVWQVSDGSSRRAWEQDPKVKITRGMLGAFFLEIDRVNPAPRVRRIQ